MAVCLVCIVEALTASPIESKDVAGALSRIQRVYVQKLGGGDTSEQMRDILIAALQNSGLFSITENEERADATIRGSSDDTTYFDEHHSSDTLGAHMQAGTGSGKNAHRYGGSGLTENESTSSKEQRHEATASVRLVGANGDVVWSTTQESSGAKFRGAMADVADKIVQRLTEDMQKARKTAAASSPGPEVKLTNN